MSTIKYTSLGSLLQEQADRIGPQEAFRFIKGGPDDVAITFEELNRSASGIAQRLSECAELSDRVLVLLSPGLELVAAFFGSALAGLTTILLPPPWSARADRDYDRIANILQDARPSAVITLAEDKARLDAFSAMRLPALSDLRWVSVDLLTARGRTDEPMPEPSIGPFAARATADTVAMLQYTSGSTGDPRGVMLTHGNLLSNCKFIGDHFHPYSKTRGVSWLPPYHDMGLIGGILQPVFAGRSVLLMSPLRFLQRPIRWLQAICEYGGTVSGGPNFAYDLCVKKAKPGDIERLDLSSWRVAFCGAEPIRAATLNTFAETFAPAGFRPDSFCTCYGLAENTLIATGAPVRRKLRTHAVSAFSLDREGIIRSPKSEPDSRLYVSNGAPQPEQTVIVVDPATRNPCRDSEVGEIWVRGPSVAIGYWDRPEATNETFRAYLNQVEDSSTGPFMRTGDLGVLIDGELYILGRTKNMIVIDGANHHPQDIEETVAIAAAGIEREQCVAFSVDVDGNERLVVAYKVKGAHKLVDEEAVRKAIAKAHGLSLYDIAVISWGPIPKTPSGKVQRFLVKEEYLRRQRAIGTEARTNGHAARFTKAC